MALESESKLGLAPGSVVDGRYRVVRVIDLGGTGVVHHVEHVQTGRNLALKTLLDSANEGRLEQEARAASHLRNPHAVRVVDMGRAADVGSYIVMELLEGTNLRTLLDDAGQLPIELASSIALQVCECLDEAHAGGIIHRDLKPGNIHLTPSFNSSYHVTVLDFGAVKLAGPAIGSHLSPNEELTRVGSTVGTPFYMSLEQLRGNASVDAVSDVYSLSVVLYEMLAGTRPFQADTLGDLVYALVQTKPPSVAGVRPDLPPELADIVTRGLSPRREERPQSARDVARVLAPLADPSASNWLRAPVSGRQMTGAMPVVAATPTPGAVVPAPAPSRPGAPAAPPGPPRPLGAPGLQPPPRPPAPGLKPPAAPPRAGALGAPTFGPKPASSTSSEHSALTFMPSTNLPAMQEQPTSALPAFDPSIAGMLPELDLGPKPAAPAPPPAPPAPPSAPKKAHPPAIKRQDTPTEMYAQGVHDSPSTTADLPDLGDLAPADLAAAAPLAPPGPPPARPPLPSSTSDDDSTSVLDLDALKAASVAKAAAVKTAPPPPAFGPSPAPSIPVLPSLEIKPGTLPAGATDTVRLDVESVSGALQLQKLGMEGMALDLGQLPEPPKQADTGPAREAPAFDPTAIGLADGRASLPGPASPRPGMHQVGAQPQHPYGTGPASTAAPPSSVVVPTGNAPSGPKTKPAWQGAVDEGMKAVNRSTTEAMGRFFVWFRKLNAGEQTTFVVCTVLGFLIALMLMVYVVIY
jgi:serine/threonine protein kinase